MPDTYSGDASGIDLTSVPVQISEPNGTDQRNAASVRTPFEKITNVLEKIRGLLSLETAPAASGFTQILRAKVASNYYARLYALNAGGYAITVNAIWNGSVWAADAGTAQSSMFRIDYTGFTAYVHAAAGTWASWAGSEQAVLNGVGVLAVTGALTALSVGATNAITAGTDLVATAGNISAVAGNISAILGSVSAATTVTAGTEARANKFRCTSAAPGHAFGLGAGTTPTLWNIVGNNAIGRFFFTTGTACPSSETLVTLTVDGGAFSNGFEAIMIPDNAATWALWVGAAPPTIQVASTSTFQINVQGTALTDSTVYAWRYILIGI